MTAFLLFVILFSILSSVLFFIYLKPIPQPRISRWESSIFLLLDPYRFISRWTKQLNSNIVYGRLFLKPAILMSGPEAAEMFYDNEKFTRKNAAPFFLKHTLFGSGAIQTLDESDEEFKIRMEIFANLMEPENINEVCKMFRTQFLDYVSTIKDKNQRIELYSQVQRILMRVACEWVGIPIKDSEFNKYFGDVVSLFEGVSPYSPYHMRSLFGRQRLNIWVQNMIDKVRDGTLRKESEDRNTLFRMISEFKDEDGKLLDTELAALEIINIIRPIVAVSVWIAFEAHALFEYPEWGNRIVDSKEEKIERFYSTDDISNFVQEVRRFYPFFPLLAAKVKNTFVWKGHKFDKGRLALLDIYGTNRDPETWEDPNVFNPDRFKKWDRSAFNFIPQGGGDWSNDHRCPGEWMTVELMKTAARILTKDIEYVVPHQDFTIPMKSIPPVPKDKFIIKSVKKVVTY